MSSAETIVADLRRRSNVANQKNTDAKKKLIEPFLAKDHPFVVNLAVALGAAADKGLRFVRVVLYDENGSEHYWNIEPDFHGDGIPITYEVVRTMKEAQFKTFVEHGLSAVLGCGFRLLVAGEDGYTSTCLGVEGSW